MKKIFALALIASLCLSACSGTGGESSTSNSSTSTSEGTSSSSSTPEQSSSSSSDASASTSSTTEGALTLEEIKAIFSELDAKDNEMVKWIVKDYSKIPIDNVPVHKVENVAVGVIGHENGVDFVGGTAVFAKVTEETLPRFPWSNIDEIKNDILKIYKSISDSGGLDYMVSEDINDPNGIFYQFDDGLYFRVSNDHHRMGRYVYWDYSTTEILQNEPNKIVVAMYEVKDNAPLWKIKRTLIKNNAGNWIFESSMFHRY